MQIFSNSCSMVGDGVALIPYHIVIDLVSFSFVWKRKLVVIPMQQSSNLCNLFFLYDCIRRYIGFGWICFGFRFWLLLCWICCIQISLALALSFNIKKKYFLYFFFWILMRKRCMHVYFITFILHSNLRIKCAEISSQKIGMIISQ